MSCVVLFWLLYEVDKNKVVVDYFILNSALFVGYCGPKHTIGEPTRQDSGIFSFFFKFFSRIIYFYFIFLFSSVAAGIFRRWHLASCILLQ